MIELTIEEHRAMQRKLARLSTASDTHDAQGRAIVATGSDARLEAILTEVDDSMLAEALVLTCADISVQIAVSGRRLVGLTRVEGMDVDDSLLSQAISPEDDTQMTVVRDVMRSLADQNGPLYLRVGEMTGLSAANTVGASVAQLREYWGLSTPEPVELSGDTPLEMLASGFGAATRATLILRDGAVAQEDGAAEHLAVLKEISEHQLQSFDDIRKAQAPSHGDPSLTYLLGAAPDECSVVVAIFESEIGLFSLSADDIGLPHRIWREVDRG